MLNRIKLFVPLICAILILIVAVLIIIFKKSSPPVSPPEITRPTATPFARKITPVISVPDVSLEKIDVRGIKINNVYKNPVEKNNQGDAVFFKNDNYQFVYQPQFSKFIISVTSSPFWEKEKTAEEDFVKELGITKKDACWLTVEITTPDFANPEESGRVYPLSFCMDI